MGLGDMVIFLPYVEAISRQYGLPVSLLVKKSTKALEFLSNNPFIAEIIMLERDDKKKNGRHFGLKGIITLASDIKKREFDKVFIFNSSLRYALIARLAKIKDVYQYQLFNKKNQNIIETAKNFIKRNFNIEVESNPIISLKTQDIINSKKKYNIEDQNINILLGVGGSGETKRVSVEK